MTVNAAWNRNFRAAFLFCLKLEINVKNVYIFGANVYIWALDRGGYA